MDWHRIILVSLVILLTQCSNHMVRCVITDVRLVGGPTSNKGTVEIREDGGAWETTCGAHLDFHNVIVICRQLEFAGANIPITSTSYGQNSTPTRGLECNGDEADLSECTLIPTGCVTAGAASCHGESYLGCFAEKHPDPVLSGNHVSNNSTMTISYCIDFCMSSSSASYTYAGVERGYECFCGEPSDDYARHGMVSDDYCHFECSGDPTESCGGVGFIAIFTINVETVETTPAVVSTVKVKEVTSQPNSEMSSNTRDAVTSSTILSTPTTLQHCSCLGVAVGEGVVIILLIATIIVLVIYILRIRKKQDSNHGQTTRDMTLVQSSSLHDRDIGFYHDIQDIRTPVPSSTPAGGSHYSSNIYDQTPGHATDPADTGIATESTRSSTRIEKDGLATDTVAIKNKKTGQDVDPYVEKIVSREQRHENNSSESHH